MLQEIAEQLSRELKINISQIVREEWEMRILERLSQSAIGDKIVFKGGTALRLAYNSPRFSDDLDFDIIKPLNFKQFSATVKKINTQFPETTISDLRNKYYTFLAEYKISDPLLPQNFSLKVEISKRQSEYGRSIRLFASPTTNLQAMLFIEEIQDILKDKKKTISERLKARDLFDIWFICQKLRQPMPKNLPKVAKKTIRQELLKYLPLTYKTIVKEIEDNYGA